MDRAAAFRRLIAAIPLVLGLAAAALITFHPSVETFVESLHTHNPAPYLPVDLATGILVGLAVGYSTYLWPVRVQERAVLRLAWWAHMLFALGPLVYLESIENSIDGFRHYSETIVVASPVELFFSRADTHWVNFLAWFPIHGLGGSYQATKLLFIVPGLVGAVFMARAAEIFVGRADPRPLVIFLFFPAALVWGSFFNKEGITYLAVGMYVYGVARAWMRPAWRPVFVGIAGLFVAGLFRFWLVFIFVAPLVVFPLAQRRNVGVAVPVLTVVAALALGGLGYILVRFGISDVAGLVAQLDAMSHYSGLTTATGRDPPRFHDLGDILVFLPVAMFTLLFLPAPWEGTHPVYLLGGLDSVLLWLAVGGGVALALARRRWDRFRSPVFLWLVLLALVWSATYTFPIYQNAGLAVRTRLMIVPALLLIPLVLNGRPERDPRFVVIVAHERGAPLLPEVGAARLKRAYRFHLEHPAPFLRLVARLGALGPSIVQTRAGPGAVPALLGAWLAGVPVRIFIASSHDRGGGIVRALATRVVEAVPDAQGYATLYAQEIEEGKASA